MSKTNLIGINPTSKYGICVIPCQLRELTNHHNNNNVKRIDKGRLVEFFEHNGDRVVLLPFNDKIKLVTTDFLGFQLIDFNICKYLNAINNDVERFQFYKNKKRLEFVLHLEKNTNVNIVVTEKLQIEAVFDKVIDENNKIFLTVFLMEKQPEFVFKILKAKCAQFSVKRLSYTFPANMIRENTAGKIITDSVQQPVTCYIDKQDSDSSCKCTPLNDDCDICCNTERTTEIKKESGTFETVTKLLNRGRIWITLQLLNYGSTVVKQQVRRILENGHRYVSSHRYIFNLPPTFEYKMDNKYRGIVVIFNHKSFLNKKHQTRKGTDKDVEALIECLPLLGFKKEHIFVKTDLHASELMLYGKRVLEENIDILKDSDCIAVFILSHGGQNDQIQAYDNNYELYKLVKSFIPKNFQPLFGKPKLFFVQACRGEEKDTGIEMDGYATDQFNHKNGIMVLPLNSDILISHSSYYNHISYRNTREGSWYIQDFCNAIKTYNGGPLATTDITEILSYTHFLISKRTEDGTKQAASFNSSLTRKLYFKKSFPLLKKHGYLVQKLIYITMFIILCIIAYIWWLKK